MSLIRSRAAALLLHVGRDRDAMASIDRFMHAAAFMLDVEGRRGLWSTRIVRSDREAFAECRVTVHRYDPMCLLVSHIRERVRGPLPVDGRLDAKFGRDLVFRLARFARCRRWETQLERDGFETTPPPAEVYRTDLITRRLLDAWGVDGRVLAATAPRPVRSRRWTIGPTAALSWQGDDLDALMPDESRALSAAFPPMVCTFELGFLRTRSIKLHGGVRVKPDGRRERAAISIPHQLPETMCSAFQGMPFREIVAHDALEDPALVVSLASSVPTGTLVEVSDPIVPLIGPIR